MPVNKVDENLASETPIYETTNVASGTILSYPSVLLPNNKTLPLAISNALDFKGT